MYFSVLLGSHWEKRNVHFYSDSIFSRTLPSPFCLLIHFQPEYHRKITLNPRRRYVKPFPVYVPRSLPHITEQRNRTQNSVKLR